MVKLCEEKGLTQGQAADLCHMKQPVIARLEAAIHSSRLDSPLKVLVFLGYTLKIVPMKKEKNMKISD